MSAAPHKAVHVGAAWRVLLRDLGLDERSILRRAGQPLSLFEGAGSRIPLDDYYALHAAVEAATDDPTLALRSGQIVSVELFDPALFAALCSPDMNAAATRLGQFKRMVGAFTLDVDIRADETRITFRCKHRPDLPLNHGLSELVFLVAFSRRATRHPVAARRVVVQRLPSDTRPYEAFFGCPLVVGEAFTLTLAAHDASRPFLTENAGMWKSFEPELRRRMVEAGEQRTIREQVEAVLLELLPSGRTQMKDVARELGLGARTLQRRLSEEQTTWLEVFNGTRERLARHYLQSSEMSPAEVSFLLGFEDPNSLFRAFRRWTGTTPESWRAAADDVRPQ